MLRQGAPSFIQPRIEILPFRILLMDQSELPGAGPVLESLLALNGRFDVVEVS